MKKYLWILSLSLVLAACSEETETVQEDFEPIEETAEEAIPEETEEVAEPVEEVIEEVAPVVEEPVVEEVVEAAPVETEHFENCTHLRTKYPSGVAQDHPAYQNKMDRDKDGWACEQ